MYCRAGFYHYDVENCSHIVPQWLSQAADDFYSEKEVAKRRQENKRKYKPTRLVNAGDE